MMDRRFNHCRKFMVVGYRTDRYDLSARQEMIFNAAKKVQEWIENFLTQPNRKVIVMSLDAFNRYRKKHWRKIATKESGKDMQYVER